LKRHGNAIAWVSFFRKKNRREKISAGMGFDCDSLMEGHPGSRPGLPRRSGAVRLERDGVAGEGHGEFWTWKAGKKRATPLCCQPHATRFIPGRRPKANAELETTVCRTARNAGSSPCFAVATRAAPDPWLFRHPSRAQTQSISAEAI
jgi:hypothetical protein